ncbi:MAG: hypothetical protein ABJA94_01665, partial [Rhodoglobus sp.]
HAPKTLDAYSADRAKLAVLKAPVKFAFTSSGIDLEYRRDQKVEYLLGMVGHLLKRVEALEAEAAVSASAPTKRAAKAAPTALD